MLTALSPTTPTTPVLSRPPLLPTTPTHSPSLRARRAFGIAALLASLPAAIVAPLPLIAQPVAGLGEDAIPIPKGGLRLVIGAHWDQWDRRLLPDGGSSPLLDGMASPSLGVSQLPALGTAQDGIRALSGASDFSLSLGPVEAAGGVRRSTTMLQADFGITRRVSIGVRVPYVEVVHDARLVLNRSGVDANVGANPARTVASGALAANGAVFMHLDDARTQLMDAITSCGTSGTGATCEAILADPAAASALVQRTETFRTAWREVYGDGTYPGAPVVPVPLSNAHKAIDASLGALRTDFEKYFTTSIPASVPVGPSLVYGSTGLQQLVQDSAFGVNADTLDRAFRAGMGDVDLEARVLLFDSWGGDQIARLSNGASGFRVMASGGWRFGTASSAQANQPFALALGEGVNAILLRATADAVWRRRAWVSATIRSTTPLADNAVVRLPGAGLPELFFFSAPQSTSRSLGQRIDLEIAPRIALGDKFGLSATWLARSIASDRYEVTGGGEAFETPSGTVQFGSIGVTYSTLASYARGRSKHAVEVLFAHEVALSASGLSVPSLVRDRLELRIYTGFPRR